MSSNSSNSQYTLGVAFFFILLLICPIFSSTLGTECKNNEQIPDPDLNNYSQSRSQRSPDTETEPNNDITSAVTNQNELTDGIQMDGKLIHITDETDCYYLDLTGGSHSTIDRVNITPEFSDLGYLNDKAVGIKLQAYTMFNGELYLLDYQTLGTNQSRINDSFNWKNSSSLIFNADRTGRYYLKIIAGYIIDSNNNQVIDPDALINYTLYVTISTTNNPDSNNDPLNGTALTNQMNNLTLNQADDHWDWYIIDSLTSNRQVNLSLTVSITDAKRTITNNYKVKVNCYLFCYDLDLEKQISYSTAGYWKDQTSNPMELFLTARFGSAYLGIQSQEETYFKYWRTDSVDCGQSTIQYNINPPDLRLINTAPQLSQWNVTPTKGNIQTSYYFDVYYADLDNDPPLFVNVTIDSVNYTMFQSSIPTNDGDYSNGEHYEITIPGTNFNEVAHFKYEELEFYYKTQDYYPELSTPLDIVKLDPFSYIEVIDNHRPTIKNGLPEIWSISEDSFSVYINLFDIFNDKEKKKYPGEELTFKLWDEVYEWTNITATENLIIEIMDNDTIRLKPYQNQYGLDKVRLLGYDVEYILEGIKAAVQYNMTINITQVNDKPILQQPIDYIDKNAMHEDKYVNITFLANDATDNNQDKIVYSIDILDKIPLMGKNPEKYQYSFSEITGNLSFLPDNNLVGEYFINITATDQGIVEPIGLTDTKQFTLTIENTNDAPIAEIVAPKNNTKFNTSSIIRVNGENSTDVDLIHGDKLKYYWYLDSLDNLLLSRAVPSVDLNPIKESGKHTLILKVVDSEEGYGLDNISIWIVSLIGDIPGGEDEDEDGMPDGWEVQYGLKLNYNDSMEDRDNDNYTNLEEFLGEDGVNTGDDSSNPTNESSIPGDLDGDSLPDWWERQMFYGSLINEKDDDLDDDGYTNYQEYLGKDGLPGNNDWSDPTKTDDTPGTIDKKSESKDDGIDIYLLVISMVIIVIVILIILFLYTKNKKKKAEEAEKASGEKKPLYTPEPMPVLKMMPPPSIGPGGLPVAQPMMVPGAVPPPTQGPSQAQVTGQQTQAQQTQKPQQLGLPPSGQVLTTQPPSQQTPAQVQTQVQQPKNQSQQTTINKSENRK